MARKENIKALFSNTRSRIIIIFLLVLVVISLLIGLTKFLFLTSNSGVAGADITGIPAMESIPGAVAPTQQYAGLVETKNIEQAKEASQTGDSAIPTIIRTQEFSSGVKPIMPEGATSGVGFKSLAMEDTLGPQQTLWFQTVKNGNCSKQSVDKAISQGATLSDLKTACTCTQLKDNGYRLSELDQACSCKELRAAGFNARQLKEAGFTAAQLRLCGFSACELRAAGFTAQALKEGGLSNGELKGAGFSDEDIGRTSGTACGFVTESGLLSNDIRKVGCSSDAIRRLRVSGVTAAMIRRLSACTPAQLRAGGFGDAALKDADFTAAEIAGTASPNCNVDALKAAHDRGVSATTIRETMGCSAEAMRAAGYTAAELKKAGFTASELKKAGFSAAELKAAGYSAQDLKDAGFNAEALKAAGFSARELQAAGFNAKELKDAGFNAKDLQLAGFSAKELKDAGFDAKALKDAGFNAAELKEAGFNSNDLKAAGYTARDLKAANFSGKAMRDADYDPKELKEADYSAKELKDGGFNAAELREGGYSASDLKAAGFTPKEFRNSGYTLNELKRAGFSEQVLRAAAVTGIAGLPAAPTREEGLGTIPGVPVAGAELAPGAANAQQLQAILKRQNTQMLDQRTEQQLQQRTAVMLTAATQFLQDWKSISTQTYVAESGSKEKSRGEVAEASTKTTVIRKQTQTSLLESGESPALIKAGDILFAVIDTAVNSDEPSPILATVVSGRFKGTKLIGTFNLPSRAEKMVISFNTMSVPGAPGTTSITAYAIDADTARTALSSSTDHHYLLRYGSLFAATFLEGFGNAIASQSTQITVGGTGGVTNTVVQSTPNNAGRSTLQNALIGLATLGKAWGQAAQQQFNTPITVQVYSGTAVGILFTQDVRSL